MSPQMVVLGVFWKKYIFPAKWLLYLWQFKIFASGVNFSRKKTYYLTQICEVYSFNCVFFFKAVEILLFSSFLIKMPFLICNAFTLVGPEYTVSQIAYFYDANVLA